MAVQIANPGVARKIALLAKATGLSKTAAVEMAVDRALQSGGSQSRAAMLAALLERFDQIPDRPDAYDPMEWDEHGLPR